MENSKQYKESSVLFGLKGSLNMHEWTKELDEQLCLMVIRNQFNFDLVSLEINEEAKALHLDFGATNVYTNEKCRLRWCYLHLKRKQGKSIKYKSPGQIQDRDKHDRIRKSSEIKQEEVKKVRFKEDQSSYQASHQFNKSQKSSKEYRQQQTHPQTISEPERLLNQKKFEDITKMKLNSVNDIEKQLWKKNIINDRKNKDYLDVSNEDFSKNKTTSIDGQQIIPSNFNIFRDSLRINSEQLLKTLNDNLPEMNLKELEQDSHDEDDDEEVLPLDFRTALIEQENKVIIQAKPLKLKTDEEVYEDALRQSNKENQFEDMDAYLEAVKKEPFNDENVIMIDPDINIKEKFEQIDLLCNIEQRINNTINAPKKTLEQIKEALSFNAFRAQAPISNKHYDTDTDGEEKKGQTNQQQKHVAGVKQEDLDFNNILKQWGVTDLNKLIGTSSDEEGRKLKSQLQTKPNVQATPNNPQQRIGIIQSIMEENRREREKNNGQPFSIDQMLADLKQSEQSEDSDVAPMSALVDIPTKEELKQKEFKQIEKAVKLASSASEDDQSANERLQKKKQQIIQQQMQSNAPKSDNDESFQIDTSSKEKQQVQKQQEETTKKKVTYYKGVKIQSDNEEPRKEKSQSSDSGDSDYFNQQRKMIKQKLQGNKNAGKEFEQDDLEEENKDEEYYEEEERQWDDDMEGFDQLRGNVSISAAQKLQEEEQKKAKIEAEKIRQEQLKRQEELIRIDQEKKQRDRDELMEKLKRQDEERKRRRKEEKDKKDQERDKEREQQRKYAEQKYMREQEEKERQKEIEEQKQKDQEWEKKRKEENERRKQGFEKSIKKLWNGSEIPCLFDSKIAYSKLLYSLPVELETNICNGEVQSDDLTFRRYKSLIIPIDELLNGEPLFEIIEFFLRFSTLKQIHNSSALLNNSFPFKCIGMTMTIAQPPFNKCSLSTIPQQAQPGSVYRVLALIFDTSDSPKTKQNFNETLKSIKLSQIFKNKSCEHIHANYDSFVTNLAFNYYSLNKIKEFPYQINANKFPIIEFVNPKDIQVDANSYTLDRMAFFLEFAIQDDIVPTTTKESWEFIRRYPAFYAQNPNDKAFTKLNSKNKVKSKYNQYQYENICIVYPDISYGQIQTDESMTKTNDSLQYFFKKAVLKNGLEICGVRMIYLDEEQQDLYQHLFNEKLITHIEDPKRQSMVAVFIRGIDAISKVERIVGHFNPDIARKTKERSVRSFFGQDKQHNCVLKMYSTQKKNMDELTFWFGGRVYNDSYIQQLKGGLQGYAKSNDTSLGTMYLLVPPKIELKYLLISPLVTARDLGVILEGLTQNGISILDIQKVDYANLPYDCAGMQNMNKENCFFKIRGKSYKVEVGYILKISRENLGSQITQVLSKVNQTLYNIDRTYGELFYLTQSEKEFKTLKVILRKSQFKINYYKDQDASNKATGEQQLSQPIKKNDPNYDSDDTEQYKDIKLYNPEASLNSSQIRKANALINSKSLTQQKGQQIHHQFETNTFMCFIKPQTQTMHAIGEIMNAIFKQGNFELLGIKMMKAKKQIYKQASVSQEVKNTVKCIAYKLNEMLTDYELRYKIYNFKAIVLVLRAKNIDQTLDTFYDKEKMKFINDFGIYNAQPSVVFLTNQTILSPLLDFFIKTKFVKLYNDFSICYKHLQDSQIFSYLITHNVQEIENSEESFSIAHIAEIKERDHLMEQTRHQESISECVCIIKPNQQLNVAIRALKVIANNENFNLQISNVQIKRYDPSQLALLFKHDIQNDDNIPDSAKSQLKDKFMSMFNNSTNPAIQVLITGEFAISKMHQLIGDRDPKLAQKDTLRTFYGVDRFENAFFVSENFSESIVEKDFLFTNYQFNSLLNSENQKQIKLKSSVQVLAQSQSMNSTILSNHFQELALILISPSLVSTNEFVYILDDLNRQKFNICSMNKVELERNDLDFLFSDLAPKLYYLDVMWEHEFSKGPSFLLVVEKEKAINEAFSLIGKFEIKTATDFEKSKKKSSSFFMPSYGDEQTTLIQEYGSYIFGFPNQAQNNKKILRFFQDLPNSQHFTIEQQ